MTTIQEIRDALTFYDANQPIARLKLFKNAPDYIRTLLAALDTKSTEISGELVERATKAEQERDALRAEVERLKSRIEWFRIQSGQYSLGPMFGTFQPKDKAPDSSGVDPLLNKPGATEI